jgi:hypothetical protein
MTVEGVVAIAGVLGSAIVWLFSRIDARSRRAQLEKDMELWLKAKAENNHALRTLMEMALINQAAKLVKQAATEKGRADARKGWSALITFAVLLAGVAAISSWLLGGFPAPDGSAGEQWSWVPLVVNIGASVMAAGIVGSGVWLAWNVARQSREAENVDETIDLMLEGVHRQLQARTEAPLPQPPAERHENGRP